MPGWRRNLDTDWDLVLDEKDQNPKAQPSTFKIVALRNFWKINIFGENPIGGQNTQAFELRIFYLFPFFVNRWIKISQLIMGGQELEASINLKTYEK